MKKKGTQQQNTSSAQDYRKEAKLHMAAIKSSWVIFAKTGVVVLAAAVVIFVATVAWFANNREVQSSGMSVEVGSNGFELMSKGTDATINIRSGGTNYNVVASDILHSITQGSLSKNNRWQSIEDGLYSAETDSGNVRVNWLLGQDSQFDAIMPGVSGCLEFYVRCDFETEIKLSLHMVPFSFTNEVTDYPLSLGEGNTSYLTQSDKIAQRLVDGHILFFEPAYAMSDDGNSRQVDENGEFIVQNRYGKLLTSHDGKMTLSSITITEEQAKNKEWVPVKIYWVWPSSLGHFFLPDGALHLDTLDKKGIFSNELRTELLTKIKEKASQFLYQANWYSYPGDCDTEEKKENFTQEKISATIQEQDFVNMNNDTYSKPSYIRLSNLYNAADQYIGMQVDYLYVSVFAE